MEDGSPGKGLVGSTGAGVGDWRLILTSDLDIEVLPYIRTSDGFVTSMHGVAPTDSTRHRVAIFNPASNPNQVSRLRIINHGTEPAAVVIAGVDDDGRPSAESVQAEIPPGEVREFRAAAPDAHGRCARTEWTGGRTGRRPREMAARRGLLNADHRREPCWQARRDT